MPGLPEPNPGRTALAWMGDGSAVITGDCGGVLAIRPVSEGALPRALAFSHLESREIGVVASHAAHENTVLYGTVNGETVVFKADVTGDGTFAGACVKLKSNPMDCAYSPEGRMIAVVGNDKDIRVVTSENNLVATLESKGSELRSVSWDPSGKMLATMNRDGLVEIWNVEAKACAASLETPGFVDVFNMEDEVLLQLARLSWRPCHEMQLALPGTMQVRIASKKSSGWGIVETFGKHQKPVTVVSWSPNGLYVSAADLSGAVKVYDAVAKTELRTLGLSVGPQIQGMAWSPTGNMIALVDSEGNFELEREVVPASEVSPTASLVGEGVTQPTSANIEAGGKETNDEDGTSTSISVLKSQTLGAAADRSEDGMRSDAIEAEEARDSAKEMRMSRQLDDHEGEFGEDDGANTPGGAEYAYAPPEPAQLPFMPSSSPNDANLNSRILVWNAAGSITRAVDTITSTIAIDFANRNTSHNIRFADNHGFEFGALALNGALFASPGEPPREIRQPESELDALEAEDSDDDGEDTSRRSVLHFRAFAAWDHNAGWTLHLPKGEQTMVVACGATFCAAVTSKRLLRIFRHGGVQEAPYLLPGPPLTACAAGPLLLVFYHRDDPSISGEQKVGYELINTGDGDWANSNRSDSCPFRVVAQGRFPLAPMATLKWVGFADKFLGHMPMAMDSEGMILGLAEASGWRWVPMLDTASKSVRRGRNHRVWPVSVRAGQLMGVIIKGDEAKQAKGPSPLRRPVLSAFPLQIPLAGLDAGTSSSKFKFEEEGMRGMLALRQREWGISPEQDVIKMRGSDEELEAMMMKEIAQLDQKILREFVLAVRLERDTRALCLARRLRLSQSMDIAISQAQQAGRQNNLLERLQIIQEILAEAEFDEQDEREEERIRSEATLFDNDSSGGHCAEGSTDASAEDDVIHTKDGEDTSIPNSSGAKRAQDVDASMPPPTRQVAKQAKRAVNPFSFSKADSSPQRKKRRGGLFDSFGGKSPPPLLSRESSFSKQARSTGSRVASQRS